MKTQKRFSSYFFLTAAAYTLCLFTTEAYARHTEPTKESNTASAVKELETYADYATMMSNPEPTIVMVHASWCSACKNFKPVFSKIAEKYKKNVHFYTLNEANKELQKELAALGVQGFPTIVYMKKDLGGAHEEGFEAKVRAFLALPEEKEKQAPVAAPKKEKAPEQKSSFVKELTTKKEYTALMKSKKPVALLLHASWCGACTMFKPTFHEVADKRNKDIQFYMLDVDNEELSDTIRSFDVGGIPTTIFFKPEGKELKEVKKMVGARPAVGFEQEIDTVLKAKQVAPKKEAAPKKQSKKSKNKKHSKVVAQ